MVLIEYIRFVDPTVFWKSTEPIGWPVNELQLLSRNGEDASPFRKSRWLSGFSHSIPGPSGAMIWADEALIREKRKNEIIENERNTLPDFLPLMLMPTPIITQSQR